MAVVLDPEGAVERSAMDVADAGGPVAAPVEAPGFMQNTGTGEGADETGRWPIGDVVAGLVLGTDEDAGVEADEGEPVCLAVGPAEGAQGGGTLSERGWRGGGGLDTGAVGGQRRSPWDPVHPADYGSTLSH